MCRLTVPRGLLLHLLVFVAAVSISAQTSEEDDFFDGGSAESTDKTTDSVYKETFTKQQPIQFGGDGITIAELN